MLQQDFGVMRAQSPLNMVRQAQQTYSLSFRAKCNVAKNPHVSEEDTFSVQLMV
jgi:hypothetical protein